MAMLHIGLYVSMNINESHRRNVLTVERGCGLVTDAEVEYAATFCR